MCGCYNFNNLASIVTFCDKFVKKSNSFYLFLLISVYKDCWPLFKNTAAPYTSNNAFEIGPEIINKLRSLDFCRLTCSVT